MLGRESYWSWERLRSNPLSYSISFITISLCAWFNLIENNNLDLSLSLFKERVHDFVFDIQFGRNLS